jgi:hypothetical protein
MTNQLDVLLLESHPGVGAESAAALTAAGHRVSRCVDEGSAGDFPCRGVGETADCPVNRHIDVALVVRREDDTEPTVREHGVTCAVRAGIPLIEDGPELADPYAPFVVERVEADLVAACERAAKEPAREISRVVLDSLGGLLDAGGFDRTAVECQVVQVEGRVRIDVSIGEPIDERTQQTLAVRAFDAVRDRTPVNADKVDISVVGRPLGSGSSQE